MPTGIPSYVEKCRGAMLAAAIGDALGWPNEPRSRNKTKRTRASDGFVEWTRGPGGPYGHDEKILAGEYSDDTQLTLSVARSLIAGDWEKFLAEREFPFWLQYERGGGGALLRAAASYKKGYSPWQSGSARSYFNAGGNGAAMRILPHVVASARMEDPAGLMTDVIKDTLLTHGHPRAFLGAACYAYALNYLLRKDATLEYGELAAAVIDGQREWGARPDPEIFGQWLNAALRHPDYQFFAEWDKVLFQMVRQLEFIKDSLQKGLVLDDRDVLTSLGCFREIRGAGDIAALSAVYLASRYANNPPLGIKVPAFALGMDTDTIASITGGLLGMLNGTSWIPPEWKEVQDYDCLIRTTDLLLADGKKPEAAGTQPDGGPWRAAPIGKMKRVDETSAPNGSRGVLTAAKWKTALGQTLYIKTSRPGEMQESPDRTIHPRQISSQVSLYDALSPVEQDAPAAAPPEPPKAAEQKPPRRLSLTSAEIAGLLDDPQFKTNMTIGKVLKVAKSLLDGGKSNAEIAKQFRVDPSLVERIGGYLTGAGS